MIEKPRADLAHIERLAKVNVDVDVGDLVVVEKGQYVLSRIAGSHGNPNCHRTGNRFSGLAFLSSSLSSDASLSSTNLNERRLSPVKSIYFPWYDTNQSH